VTPSFKKNHTLSTVFNCTLLYKMFYTECNFLGPDSSCLTHMKVGRTSGSYSSGLDLLTGEGGSLPSSPWGTTATVSLEYNGSQNEDKDGSRRGSGHGEGLTTGSSVVLQHGFGRQRSELSDYVSEDQALEEYGAIFTQVGK
jgi:hypothetical protein